MLNNSPSTIREKQRRLVRSNENPMYFKLLPETKSSKSYATSIPTSVERRREKCDEFLQWYAAKTGKRYD